MAKALPLVLKSAIRTEEATELGSRTLEKFALWLTVL